MNDLLDTLADLGWESDEAIAEREVRAEGLRVIREFFPNALELVVQLEQIRRPDNGWGIGHDETGYRCAYRSTDRGFQWQAGGALHLLTWDDLRGFIEDDALRPKVIAWSDSLTSIDAWRDRYRPYELWPMPGSWHPSYIENDRSRSGYADRMTAWRRALAILETAELGGAA